MLTRFRTLFGIVAAVALLPHAVVFAASPGRTFTLAAPATGTSTTTPDKGTGPQALSADGRYLIFSSDASNLVPNFVDHETLAGSSDYYMRDLQTGTTTLITHKVGSTSENGNGRNFLIRMSDDGSVATFTSESTTIGGSPTNATSVYIWERATNTVSLLCNASIVGSATLAMSGDGVWVAILTDTQMPKNIKDSSQGSFAHGGNGYYGIYLVNRSTGAVVLVTYTPGSRDLPSNIANPQFGVFLSTDGRYCSFKCSAVITGWDSNFTGTFPTGCQAYYLFDRQTDTMTLMSKRNDGSAVTTAFQNGTMVAMSPDGRYSFFTCNADVDFGTATPDNNGVTNDLYRYDRDGGSTKLARMFFDVYPLNPTVGVSIADISPNGRYYTITTTAALLGEDTNSRSDGYLLDTMNTTTPFTRFTVKSDGSQWTAAEFTVAAGNLVVGAPQVDNSGQVAFSANANAGFGLTDNNAMADTFFATFAPASDTTKPTVLSVVRQNPSSSSLATGTGSVTFRVTYSEPVTGVVAANFQLQSVNGGTVAGTVSAVSAVSTSVYDVTVTITGGSGDFSLKVVN